MTEVLPGMSLLLMLDQIFRARGYLIGIGAMHCKPLGLMMQVPFLNEICPGPGLNLCVMNAVMIIEELAILQSQSVCTCTLYVNVQLLTL